MPSEAREYDLLIIGGGPAGIVAAATAKGRHKTVALVDNRRDPGGTGVNTATVPSKTLRETALALSGVKARKLVGVDLSLRLYWRKRDRVGANALDGGAFIPHRMAVGNDRLVFTANCGPLRG